MPVRAFASVLATVPGAVATAIAAQVVNWTFTAPNPDFWLIQQSQDGGVTWDFLDKVAGTLRTYSYSVTGALARVVGIQTDGTIFCAASNAVTVLP